MNERGESESEPLRPVRDEPRWTNPHRKDAVYDLLGRKEPRTIDLNLVLTACGGWWVEKTNSTFLEQFRRVPARAVPEEGEDDDGRYALVSCPCGAKPIVRASLAKCGGCERYYAQSRSGRVFVTYGEMDPPAA